MFCLKELPQKVSHRWVPNHGHLLASQYIVDLITELPQGLPQEIIIYDKTHCSLNKVSDLFK